MKKIAKNLEMGRHKFEKLDALHFPDSLYE